MTWTRRLSAFALALGCACGADASASGGGTDPTSRSHEGIVPEATPPAAGTAPRSELVPAGTVELPGAAPGIGFDDLRFSPELDRILVPAGRSGRLDLVDPASREVSEVAGFSEQRGYAGGHDDGVTSADWGAGLVYATDRTSQRLVVVDPTARSVVRSVDLAAHLDYVRWVAPTRELWVTEPDADQLEIFSVGDDGRSPVHAATVPVRGGPESLVIDARRSRAYTHLWRGATVAVDLTSRAIVARWDNGCRSSRGIALDEAAGFLVAACSEGKATVLDVRDGHRVSDITTGAGVDVIDYDPERRHLYVPSAEAASMTVAALSMDGRLTSLGTVPTARGAHCVTTDRRGGAYVCDPTRGRLIVVHDTLVSEAPPD